MICEYYDIDGQKVAGGEFSLLTKSLYQATVDAEIITAFAPLKYARQQSLHQHRL